MNLKGIDVSKWQGNINWKEAKADGVEFAIIREGYGKESPFQVDKQFESNYVNAKSVGMPIGVYHYSYASSKDDAIAEAKFCLKNISGKQFEYPVCFDIEDKELLKLNNQQRTDICKAFCEIIEDAGFYAMIYCNLDWYKNYLCSDQLKDYDLWLAQWNVGAPSVDCGIWQKSSTGIIDGTSGNVDLNEAYKDYSSIMKSKGLNGFNFTTSSNTFSTTHQNYTVQKGDSLWSIAQKQMGDGTKWPQIQKLNNLSGDIIYPGQALKIPK